MRYCAQILAVFLAFAFAGCAGTAIKIESVRAIPTSKPYLTYSCEQLDQERARIEPELDRLRRLTKHGTRDKIGVLKGEAEAVNDSIARQGCRVPLVKMPDRWRPKEPLRYTGGAPYE